MTQYFQPTVAHDRNVTARIKAVYAAAGQDAPTSFVHTLKQHLRTVPDMRQAAASIAAEAYTTAPGTDPAQFWADAVDQIIRAQGADALKHALTESLAAQERASAARQIDRAMTDLKPWADRHAAALVTAVKPLPAGDTALAPEAVLAADAGKHLTAARTALQALALYASIPDTARHQQSAQQAHRLLPIIDPGKPQTEVRSVFGKTFNSDKMDNTRAVRNIDRDVRRDMDLTLIRAARGDYPGVTLAPAESSTDITDRAARARDAFITRQPTPSEESLIHMR